MQGYMDISEKPELHSLRGGTLYFCVKTYDVYYSQRVLRYTETNVEPGIFKPVNPVRVVLIGRPGISGQHGTQRRRHMVLHVVAGYDYSDLHNAMHT